MRWWPWSRNGHETAEVRRAADRKLDHARRETDHIQARAEEIARLPTDEFMARVAAAFRRPPT